ncbi:MAG: aldehyde dehydrogenase family protein [Nocardioidaceae bacterium]|nr:aldehyde dehydrogenase family protein [Nocardioidaceae bacterium]
MTVNEVSSRHQGLLERIVEAVSSRHSWSAYAGRTPDGPSRDEAESHLDALRGQSFDLVDHPGVDAIQSDEISPYTGQPLGVSYPRAKASTLVELSSDAVPALASMGARGRAELCLEMSERLFARNHQLAVAAMHTTGQGKGMSASGSGTNALDRGLEALGMAHLALDRVPKSARWDGQFGKSTVSLEKTYRTVPLGPAVVVACASFPAWNVYPAVFANLVTANPVIVKPHPTSVLQMAMAVQIMRQTLVDFGVDPNAVLLSVDTAAAPITKELVTHAGVRIVDFTGSAEFGAWVEENARQAVVFSETSGANSVVLESLADVDASLRAIAGSLSLFSGQMCTAPQNIYVPAGGIDTPDGVMSPEEFATGLVAAIRGIADEPKRAAAVLGAVQSAGTITSLQDLAAQLGERGEVLTAPKPYPHPEFEGAQTCVPLVSRVSIEDHDLYETERFGPVTFLISCPDAAEGLAQASRDAAEHGAISAFLFSQDESFIAEAEDAFAQAGAALTINVTGAMPMHFSAAYSDYHVSGLNPAGTATLSDDAFVSTRFRVVQSRRPVGSSPHRA